MSESSISVAILVRVSTSKQETNRQISELSAFAAAKGYEVVEICREQVSGMADKSVRNAAKITGKGISTVQRVKKVLIAK